MHWVRSLGLALFVSSVLCGAAEAQKKGALEMGYDVGLVAQFDDPPSSSSSFDDVNVGTSLAAPSSDVSGVSTLRLGYLLSEHSEVESRFGFASIASSNTEQDDVNSAALGLDFAQHFGNGRSHFFLRGGARWNSITRGSGPAISQFGMDGGFGVKTDQGHQFATRVELGLARFFDTDNHVGHTDLALTLGISFFTR